jgi:hypothetical protein
MLGMKTMSTVFVAQGMQLMKGTGTRISSKSSVPDNCIVLKGEVLEYRDSLTQVFVYQTKSFLNYGKEREEKINTDRLHGKVERNS